MRIAEITIVEKMQQKKSAGATRLGELGMKNISGQLQYRKLLSVLDRTPLPATKPVTASEGPFKDVKTIQRQS